MSNQSFPPLALANSLTQGAEEIREWARDMIKKRDAYEKNGLDVKYRNENELFDAVRATSGVQEFALARWMERKQVYAFDKSFIDVLMTSPLDGLLYDELFERLPYPCFVIKIGDSYGIVDYNKGDFFPGQHYIGFFPFVNDNTGLRGTTLVLNRGVDWQLPDVKETMKDISENFSTDASSLTAMMIQICLYLSANNAVIHENPEQKKIYRPPFDEKHPKNRFSEVRIWDCGIRYTKDTVKAIRNDVTYESEKGNRRSPRPHWRRAHWKHYHVGKGRTEIILKWIEPSFVGQGNTPIVVHVKEDTV